MSLLGMKSVGHLERPRRAPQRADTCLFFNGQVEGHWIDQRARRFQPEGEALSKAQGGKHRPVLGKQWPLTLAAEKSQEGPYVPDWDFVLRQC